MIDERGYGYDYVNPRISTTAMTDAREIRYQISLAQWWAFGSVCVLVAPLEISERPLLVHRRAVCVAVVE
jgi:hypothetical protein